MDGRIFHIQSQLSQNLGHSWSVGEMAETVRLSTSHFKQLFKQKVGVSPMAYLLALRLEAAIKILSDPLCFLRIKEIGFLVGITDESRFTSEFKRKFGMTPTQFRHRSWKVRQSEP